MNTKIFAGSLASFMFNECVAHLPVRVLRNVYLRLYLKGIGKFTSFQMGCKFLNGRKVTIGANNVINFGCLFDGRKYEIRTGNNVSIGPEATILTLGHDPQSPTFEDKGGNVIIEDYVWIGYRAIILPGVNIGKGAVVGAGAVVSRDVEPYTINAGNPAREIGKRFENLTYQLNFNPFLL